MLVVGLHLLDNTFMQQHLYEYATPRRWVSLQNFGVQYYPLPILRNFKLG
jgi:hypothetical protein